MSFTGFAATFLVVWAFYTFLPDGLLATRVARGIAMFGLFLLVVIELPLVGWALWGPGLPPVENQPRRRPEEGAMEAAPSVTPLS